MNDIYNRDFMLNIDPSGISLVSVNSIDTDLRFQDSFDIEIDTKKCMSGTFSHFYKLLMETLSNELIYKVMDGQIYNGDILRLKPSIEEKNVLIKVSIFRSYDLVKNLDTYIKKFIENIPNAIAEKKEEINSLRYKLNLAIEEKNYSSCQNLIKKINYIKDEFII